MDNEKLQKFATMLHQQQIDRLAKEFPSCPDPKHYVRVTVKKGKKYTKVDVGDSGKYMVVNDTGEIFGIKAYGVIHRGHRYGTLDTINDWHWGNYTAYPINNKLKIRK